MLHPPIMVESYAASLGQPIASPAIVAVISGAVKATVIDARSSIN